MEPTRYYRHTEEHQEVGYNYVKTQAGKLLYEPPDSGSIIIVYNQESRDSSNTKRGLRIILESSTAKITRPTANYTR